MTIPKINAAEFDTEVIRSNQPVLVDFFTATCQPCVDMLPILAEVLHERAAALRIAKFDAGEDPEFASRFRVKSVPNLILFKNGFPVGQRVGRISKRELLAWVDEAIA